MTLSGMDFWILSWQGLNRTQIFEK